MRVGGRLIDFYAAAAVDGSGAFGGDCFAGYSDGVADVDSAEGADDFDSPGAVVVLDVDAVGEHSGNVHNLVQIEGLTG